jgi:hypothetical protein
MSAAAAAELAGLPEYVPLQSVADVRAAERLYRAAQVLGLAM